MSKELELKPEDKVLEIGTGSGYQAAVLAQLAKEVYSIEIVEPLAREARERLERLADNNVRVGVGGGYPGRPEAAPLDAIIWTAAPDPLPPVLPVQLRQTGAMGLAL